MAEFSSTSQMTGFFYEVYDKIVSPIPESAKFMGKVPFKGGALELGNKLHLNVVVTDEGGFTYAGPNAGAFNVNAGIAFQTQDAQVDAYQLILQGSVDYESAARASSSRKAFLELVGKKLQVMVASTKRRFETELLYGQWSKGIGTVNGAPAANVITIADATWAPQVWIGKVNQKIDSWPAAGGAATATGMTITKVDVAQKKITVDNATGVASTNVLRWAGSYTGASVPNTCMGAFAIAGNTGTMFNIDGSTYDVWQGNTYDIGTKILSLARVMNAMGILANRGLDGDVVLWVSPKTWSTMVTDQAALRRYRAEVVSKFQNGAKAITFAYQTGNVDIIGHGAIMEGYALVTELNKWKRVGSQDFSFKTPGLEQGKDIFWHDPSRAGFSYRYYGGQALFCEMPSHQMVITGIDNVTA